VTTLRGGIVSVLKRRVKGLFLRTIAASGQTAPRSSRRDIRALRSGIALALLVSGNAATQSSKS
jgi:hypothetical protein